VRGFLVLALVAAACSDRPPSAAEGHGTAVPEWFTDGARESGLDFVHFNGMTGEFSFPEVIAPGIWVPAPILPHTPTAAEAELYAKLHRATDEELRPLIEEHKNVDQDFYDARNLPTYLIRQLVSVKLHEADVISEHYKFVDGTSFAAPIVSSTVACMLEANPNLTPQQVKRILIDTAERLPDVEIDRQGWGVIAPRRAVEIALAIRPH